MAMSDAERARRYRERQRGGPPRQPAPCGTRQGAQRHRRDGDVPDGQQLGDVCTPCAEAERQYNRVAAAERRRRARETAT